MGQIQKAGEQRFRTIGGRRDGEKEMENKMKVQREKRPASCEEEDDEG